MATNTINQNVNTAITDFGLIKQAIVNKGVSVPSGTPTSQYGNKISSIQTGADVSGVTATAGDVDTGKVFVDSTGTEVTGTSTYKADYTALNTLVGQTTAVAEDVAQGKVFVNSSGVQTTGTASGGDDTEFIKTIERNGTEQNLDNITLPEGTTILSRVFSEYYYLGNLNIPDSVTIIRENAFWNCYNMTLTSLPSNLDTIEPYAFYECRSVSFTTLPNKLLKIEDYAFLKCIGLTSITFTCTPTTLHSGAFNGCTNITTIRVPWSSGEVANSPWGATNATIIYDYTP